MTACPIDHQKRFRFGVLVIAAIGVVLLVTSGITAVALGNGEFFFYVIALGVITAVVTAIHLRVNFTTPLLVLLLIWAVAHMLGGLMPVPDSWPIAGHQRVLYSLWLWPDAGSKYGGWLKYDQLVHAFGFGATAWACWQALAASIACTAGVARRAVKPTLGRLMLIAAAALGFGALNEVVEFAATLMGPTNVGGYVNTGFDLVANTVGAVIAAAAIRIFHR